MAPSWLLSGISCQQHSPAGRLLRPLSLRGDQQGPSEPGTADRWCFPFLLAGGGRGVWLRSARLDTGEVVCRSQVCFFLVANEKSSGRNGVQTDLGLQMCAGVCHHVAFVLPPHLREEGPLSKTVYLPTCHGFAKTMILKDLSPSSVRPGRGAAFWVGCTPPASVPLGALQRPAPGRRRFPSL